MYAEDGKMGIRKMFEEEVLWPCNLPPMPRNFSMQESNCGIFNVSIVLRFTNELSAQLSRINRTAIACDRSWELPIKT
jgi:hypothetical protein